MRRLTAIHSTAEPAGVLGSLTCGRNRDGEAVWQSSTVWPDSFSELIRFHSSLSCRSSPIIYALEITISIFFRRIFLRSTSMYFAKQFRSCMYARRLCLYRFQHVCKCCTGTQTDFHLFGEALLSPLFTVCSLKRFTIRSFKIDSGSFERASPFRDRGEGGPGGLAPPPPNNFPVID